MMAVSAGFAKRPAYALYHITWSALDWLYPPVCGGCEKPGNRWCNACREAVQVIDQRLACPLCGKPTPNGVRCTECTADPLPIKSARSWGIYADPLREAIHSFKFRHNLSLGDDFSMPMIQLLDFFQWKFDIILAVPITLNKYRDRGYNQSNLLARPISLATGVKFLPNAIKRIRETAPQMDLNVWERRKNTEGAFIANPKELGGKNVLLVDDIITTGATIRACGAALALAGVREVYVISLARTVLTSESLEIR